MSVFGYLSFVTVGESDNNYLSRQAGGQRLKTGYGWKKERADGMVSRSAERSTPSSITAHMHDTHTHTHTHTHTQTQSNHTHFGVEQPYWGHKAQQNTCTFESVSNYIYNRVWYRLHVLSWIAEYDDAVKLISYNMNIFIVEPPQVNAKKENNPPYVFLKSSFLVDRDCYSYNSHIISPRYACHLPSLNSQRWALLTMTMIFPLRWQIREHLIMACSQVASGQLSSHWLSIENSLKNNWL